MNIDDRGLLLIEQFEGFSAYQYRDSVGVLTIGFGTTSADISPLPRYLTRSQAGAILRDHVNAKYAPAVNGLGVPLNQNQFDALVSLAYNCGPGAMSWQIGRDLRAHNYGAAANDFMNYVYAGGQVLQGLVNRRAAERALFLTPAAPAPDLYWYFLNENFSFTRKWLASQRILGRNHPYLLRSFNGPVLTLNEKRTVAEYDRLVSQGGSALDIRYHKLWILVLRTRLAWAANTSHDWTRYHRRRRWTEMWTRTRTI